MCGGGPRPAMPLYFIVVEGKKGLDESHVEEIRFGLPCPAMDRMPSLPALQAGDRAAVSCKNRAHIAIVSLAEAKAC